MTTSDVKTIWILDDDEAVNSVWQRVLEAVGYRVVTHTDSVEGMAWYSTHEDDVDLLILDVMMPGLDGGDCLATIRLIRTDLPVIISTGYAESETVDQMVQKGVTGVLRKPFKAAECLSMVSRALQA